MIVIGGSLGGCDALKEILRRLPAAFPHAIAVALHRHKDSGGMLMPMLQRGCALPVAEVDDKDEIRPGRVHVCPADYHLMIEGGSFALSTDDLVNFARPSIDVLFESAAEWQGARAVGVILTGAGSDGSRGAQRIGAAGGLVLVQDPAGAEGPWMPGATIASTPGAHVLSLSAIAEKLLQLPVCERSFYGGDGL